MRRVQERTALRFGAIAALLVGMSPYPQDDAVKKQDEEFWTFVGRLSKIKKGFSIPEYEPSEAFFEKSDPKEIATLWKGLEQRFEELHRWDVWAVGAIAQGFLSTDFLGGYKVWIILKGKEFYEAVLKDPTKAGDRIPTDEPSSAFGYISVLNAARNVYEEKTGRELKDLDKSFEQMKLKGDAWTWRDLKTLHPDLWERFFVKRDRRPKLPELKKLKDADLVWIAVGPLHNWVDIYDEVDYFEEQYRLLSKAQRCLHAVAWTKSEVDNGGYRQFFGNATGIVASEALEGYKLFGAKDHHEQLEKIMAAFPDGASPRDRKKRNEQLSKRWPDYDIEDDFPLAKDAEDLDAVVAKYIREHPEEFFRSK